MDDDMKKIEQYKCEYCGTMYENEEECLSCENQHIVALDVVVQHHRPKKVAAKYPPRIDVEMSDGTVSIYERIGTK